MIVGYIGEGNSFAQAIVDFAVAYADQTDCEELQRSLNGRRAGRQRKIRAERKVVQKYPGP